MGLDCSHGAFHGAYTAFNRLRQVVALAAGGSFPPHYVYSENWELMCEDGAPVRLWKEGEQIRSLQRRTDLDANSCYVDDGYTKENVPGLFCFLEHSDCDGEIEPEMCKRVADELEALLPSIEEHVPFASGHIALQGGYAAVLRTFIAGCRAAHAAGEPLRFY